MDHFKLLRDFWISRLKILKNIAKSLRFVLFLLLSNRLGQKEIRFYLVEWQKKPIVKCYKSYSKTLNDLVVWVLLKCWKAEINIVLILLL
jgi:hypothetical protein